MNPNPLLKKLGFSNDDRVVIIHADDVGMCQATISACEKLFLNVGITSAAVMVPCPWFLAAVDMINRLDKFDLGVHLTLTSEWDTFRWRPISSCDPVSGMIDSQGYFHKKSADVFELANETNVKIEINKQIDKAIEEGIVPTHIDTHMGSVAHPKFMFDYILAGVSRKIPPMVFRLTKDEWVKIGLDDQSATLIEGFLMNLEEQGIPLLDHLRSIPLDQPQNRFEQAKSIFKELPPGITHFIIHPAEETPEIKYITKDWECRVGDYQLFMEQKMQHFLKDQGINLIGYKEIKDKFPISDSILS